MSGTVQSLLSESISAINSYLRNSLEKSLTLIIPLAAGVDDDRSKLGNMTARKYDRIGRLERRVRTDLAFILPSHSLRMEQKTSRSLRKLAIAAFIAAIIGFYPINCAADNSDNVFCVSFSAYAHETTVDQLPSQVGDILHKLRYFRNYKSIYNISPFGETDLFYIIVPTVECQAICELVFIYKYGNHHKYSKLFYKKNFVIYTFISEGTRLYNNVFKNSYVELDFLRKKSFYTSIKIAGPFQEMHEKFQWEKYFSLSELNVSNLKVSSFQECLLPSSPRQPNPRF